MKSRKSRKWSSWAEALFAGGVVLFAQGLAEGVSFFFLQTWVRPFTIIVLSIVLLVVAWTGKHDISPE